VQTAPVSVTVEPPPSPVLGSEGAGWSARLRLGFAHRGGRTVLTDRAHFGPLVVQRPFYPEGDDAVCHVYVVHPPGGVVAGDRLEIDVRADGDAHALLTTPAAGKFYRSDGGLARQSARIVVSDGPIVEWLPLETIAFDGTRARLTTSVEIEGAGRFVGWEVLCVGRPASGEAFTRGEVEQRLEVFRDGVPLLVERAKIAGGAPVLHAGWGMRGATVVGTLVATVDGKEAVAAARRALESFPTASVTSLAGVTVVRTLGDGAEAARMALCAAWRALRPLVTGREACEPRIWST